MIIPIRCFTCNKVIADKWDLYLSEIQKANIEEDIPNDKKKKFVSLKTLEEKTVEGKVLDKLGFNRYCCRRMFLSHVELCERI